MLDLGSEGAAFVQAPERDCGFASAPLLCLQRSAGRPGRWVHDWSLIIREAQPFRCHQPIQSSLILAGQACAGAGLRLDARGADAVVAAENWLFRLGRCGLRLRSSTRVARVQHGVDHGVLGCRDRMGNLVCGPTGRPNRLGGDGPPSGTDRVPSLPDHARSRSANRLANQPPAEAHIVPFVSSGFRVLSRLSVNHPLGAWRRPSIRIFATADASLRCIHRHNGFRHGRPGQIHHTSPVLDRKRTQDGAAP